MSSHSFLGQPEAAPAGSPYALTSSLRESITPRRNALEKAVEAEEGAVTKLLDLMRDVPPSASLPLPSPAAAPGSYLEVASNSWCDMFRKAASVKPQALAGGDRPEHDVRLAYEHCLVADAAFQSLRLDDAAADVDVAHSKTFVHHFYAPTTTVQGSTCSRSSSPAGGTSFGVFYMARLVASLVTSQNSNGASLQELAIDRLRRHCVPVADNVPRWEAVLSCANTLLAVVRRLAEGAASQSEMVARTLSGLAFFFAVDAEVVPVATLYHAALSDGLGLRERLVNEGALSSAEALSSLLRGRAALRQDSCILDALDPDKMFRPLPPLDFEGKGFWRLSAAPEILPLPVPTGRKADVLKGAHATQTMCSQLSTKASTPAPVLQAFQNKSLLLLTASVWAGSFTNSWPPHLTRSPRIDRGVGQVSHARNPGQGRRSLLPG